MVTLTRTVFICLSETTSDRQTFRLPHGKGTSSTFESQYSRETHFSLKLSVKQTPTKSNSWGVRAEPSLFYASQHRYIPKGSFPWHGWARGLLCRGVGAGESASSSSLHALSTGLQEKPQRRTSVSESDRRCLSTNLQNTGTKSESSLIPKYILYIPYRYIFLHLLLNRNQPIQFCQGRRWLAVGTDTFSFKKVAFCQISEVIFQTPTENWI